MVIWRGWLVLFFLFLPFPEFYYDHHDGARCRWKFVLIIAAAAAKPICRWENEFMNNLRKIWCRWRVNEVTADMRKARKQLMIKADRINSGRQSYDTCFSSDELLLCLLTWARVRLNLPPVNQLARWLATIDRRKRKDKKKKRRANQFLFVAHRSGSSAQHFQLRLAPYCSAGPLVGYTLPPPRRSGGLTTWFNWSFFSIAMATRPHDCRAKAPEQKSAKNWTDSNRFIVYGNLSREGWNIIGRPFGWFSYYFEAFKIIPPIRCLGEEKKCWKIPCSSLYIMTSFALNHTQRRNKWEKDELWAWTYFYGHFFGYGHVYTGVLSNHHRKC